MEQPLKILFLEDVQADAELVQRELARGGIKYQGRRVESREDFIRELDAFAPHIILADYNLPQFSALEALHVLRDRASDVPLILVTGTHSRGSRRRMSA